MTLRQLAGSGWYKGDWHVHTPFSRCYQDWGITPADIWQKLADLDFAVITDHNTFAGYLNLLQHMPIGATTTLFPGVELKVPGGYGGLSLLVVLNPELGPEELRMFLREIGLRGTDEGEPEIILPITLLQAATIIRKYEGIALWTRINTDQGILYGVDQGQRDYILNLGWPNCFLDWGQNQENQGQAATVFTGVWSSNAHRLEDIGTSCTLIKAEQLDFAGLKFALQDPDARLRPGGTWEEKPYPKIISMKVKGGFLEGQEFLFNSSLNCVIGPRGAGKSTLLNLLGFALGVTAAGQEGLLPEGEVQLELYHPQRGKLTLTRRGGERVRVVDGQGQLVTVSLEDFALAFTQGEIERVMLQPQYQLKLLDSMGDWGQLKQEKDQLSKALADNSSQLSDLQVVMDDLEERLAVRTGLEQRLSELQAYPLAEIQNSLAERDREIQTYTKLQALIKQTLDNLARVACGSEAAAHIEILNPAVRETLQQVARLSSLWQQGAEELSCLGEESEQRYHLLEQEYQVLLGGCADSKVKELVGERKRVQTALIKLEPLVTELQQALSKWKQLKVRRLKLLQNWTSLGEEIYHRRTLEAAKVNALVGPTVRLEVKRCGQIAPYHDYLLHWLPGTIGNVIKSLEKCKPWELQEFLENNEPSALAKQTGLPLERCRQVLGRLGCQRALLQLETLDLPDLVQIYLKDGQGEKAGNKLSTGQRCTAVIPLLFLAGQGPLIIDQPEDQLDNAYVYSVLVAKLRQFKGVRQFILATHNPNIPVLADAEQNFILQSDGQNGKVQAQGYIENAQVKALIQEIMEGGSNAFRRRAECYGQLAL